MSLARLRRRGLRDVVSSARRASTSLTSRFPIFRNATRVTWCGLGGGGLGLQHATAGALTPTSRGRAAFLGWGGLGKKLFRGEETDLIKRALGLGLKIAYDTGLTVFHRIGSDRMRKIYFCRLEFDSAQGEARARPATRRSFLGAPLWSYRRACTDFWKWVGLVLLKRPGAFDQQLASLRSAGELSGYWKVRLMRH